MPKSYFESHPHVREMLKKNLKYILLFVAGLIIFFSLYATVDQETFQELVKDAARKVGLLEDLPTLAPEVEPQ